MNKKICLLILLIVFCKQDGKNELTQEEIDFDNQLSKPSVFYYVNSKSGLRLRENPSLDSDKIVLIPFNSPVEILAEDDHETTIDNKTGKWLKISFIDEKGNGYDGYAFSPYLSPENQIRFFNKQKNYYYSALFEPKCSNDISTKCSVITFYNLENKPISNFTWDPQKVNWYNDSIVSVSEVNADGGGYAFSLKHFNILDSKMRDIYSYGASFDDDQKGFRKLKVYILNRYYIFELNTNSNSLIISESDYKYEHENKILNIKSPPGLSIDLDLDNKILDIDFDKSIINKEKLIFSFFNKKYEIKF